MTNEISNQLGLIDPLKLKTDEIILHQFKYEMFPEKDYFLVNKGKYLVCLIKFFSKLTKEWLFTQSEFPLDSIPWIIERLENGFWKRPEDGGLSNFERSVSEEFDRETIGINVMMHCCEENMPGYKIWNSSRKNYISNTASQSWNIPTYMLKDDLLDELKKIVAEYC